LMKYNYQNKGRKYRSSAITAAKGTLHRFEKVIGKKFPDKVVVVLFLKTLVRGYS